MLEDYFFSKNIRFVLWGVFALAVALLIFHAGVVVGSHQPMRGRVTFDARTGPGPMNGLGGGLVGGFMPKQSYVESGHGAIGTIATVTLPTFILASRDGEIEKIYAGTSTMVTGGSMPGTGALAKGQFVIVIGDPNDSDDEGYLDARIIKILPQPPQSASGANVMYLSR